MQNGLQIKVSFEKLSELTAHKLRALNICISWATTGSLEPWSVNFVNILNQEFRDGNICCTFYFYLVPAQFMCAFYVCDVLRERSSFPDLRVGVLNV